MDPALGIPLKSWSFPWDSHGTPVLPQNPLKVLVFPVGPQSCNRNPCRIPLGSSRKSRDLHGTPVLFQRHP